jgi:hypothetical protein
MGSCSALRKPQGTGRRFSHLGCLFPLRATHEEIANLKSQIVISSSGEQRPKSGEVHGAPGFRIGHEPVP